MIQIAEEWVLGRVETVDLKDHRDAKLEKQGFGSQRKGRGKKAKADPISQPTRPLIEANSGAQAMANPQKQLSEASHVI